jgi:hypothetical protein
MILFVSRVRAQCRSVFGTGVLALGLYFEMLNISNKQKKIVNLQMLRYVRLKSFHKNLNCYVGYVEKIFCAKIRLFMRHFFFLHRQ